MGQTDWERVCWDSLGFFGKITASVSHELKNHLSTIKEQTGLISDLMAMASEGRPLDPGRIGTLVQNITRRIGQTDEVIKRLNRFAHSTDQPSQEADFNEIVESIVALSQRLASVKGVELAISLAPEPILVETSPFLLRQLVFLCLSRLIELAGKGGRVEVATEPADEDKAGCRFFSQTAGQETGPALPETWPAKSLAELLGAGLKTGESRGEIRLEIPRRLGQPLVK